MKLPEYSLIEGIEVKSPDSSDPVEFPSGTLVFPFWSEHNLTVERREELRELTKFHPKKDDFVMCIIGRMWVPIDRKNIRKN